MVRAGHILSAFALACVLIEVVVLVASTGLKAHALKGRDVPVGPFRTVWSKDSANTVVGGSFAVRQWRCDADESASVEPLVRVAAWVRKVGPAMT